MANTIGSDELGQDETNQLGQQNSPGQNNANQAGQAPQQQSQGNAPAIGGGGPNQPNNPNQQKGSGYTNIQKVISANQGNQLGSTIGNNLQQVGSSAQNNLKNAQNQFNQQTSQNQFNTDANNQLVQNVLNDPTQAVGNNQGSQFSNLISGQYQGPQGLQNAQQLQGQAASAAQMGQALGSAGGRIGLLQQLVGNKGQYTAGQANLDNLLLGQSQDPSLQAAKRQALTLQGQTNNAIQGASAQGQQNVNAAKQFGQGVRDQFGNVVTSANDALQKQATEAQQGRDTQYQKSLADLKSGNISQQEADQLGLTQGENVYNLLNDPSKFLSESSLKANSGNIASSQDYAKMQALQKLGGQYAGQNAKQALNNFQDPTQAGRFANDQGITGDQTGFANQLGKTTENYNSIYQPALQGLQSAQDISRLANGQVNQQEFSSFLAAHPEYNNGYFNMDNPAATALAAQSIIQSKYPSASTNGNTRTDWANSNLQTNQANYNNTMSQLQDTYGTPETININPSQYPAMQQGLGQQRRPEDQS